MVVNMWKNSLKNVESDNNKILYKTLLDFFYYSATVLTFGISLISIFTAMKTLYPVHVNPKFLTIRALHIFKVYINTKVNDQYFTIHHEQCLSCCSLFQLSPWGMKHLNQQFLTAELPF